jgi:hypothetical protein
MDKPQQLATISLRRNTTPAEQYAKLGPIARRHGKYPKGTVLPETQVGACPRRRVQDFPDGFLKQKWIEQQEQNQKIALCCRHPENMEIAAFKSHPEEQAPDIYIFYCNGLDDMGRRHHEPGRRHIKFCIGETDDQRPEWK